MSISQRPVLIYGIRMEDIPQTEENKEILEHIDKDIEDGCIDFVNPYYDVPFGECIVGVGLAGFTMSEEELISEIKAMKALVPHYLKKLPLEFHLCMDVF